MGLDLAVHGEAATAMDAMVNEIANNFHTSFFGEPSRSYDAHSCHPIGRIFLDDLS